MVSNHLFIGGESFCGRPKSKLIVNGGSWILINTYIASKNVKIQLGMSVERNYFFVGKVV